MGIEIIKKNKYTHSAFYNVNDKNRILHISRNESIPFFSEERVCGSYVSLSSLSFL
jgi:hypothetical protein